MQLRTFKQRRMNLHLLTLTPGLYCVQHIQDGWVAWRPRLCEARQPKVWQPGGCRAQRGHSGCCAEPGQERWARSATTCLMAPAGCPKCTICDQTIARCLQNRPHVIQVLKDTAAWCCECAVRLPTQCGVLHWCAMQDAIGTTTTSGEMATWFVSMRGWPRRTARNCGGSQQVWLVWCGFFGAAPGPSAQPCNACVLVGMGVYTRGPADCTSHV